MVFNSAMGLPVISPVCSFSVRPSGSGVLSCMKKRMMMFLYAGLPLLTSVPSTNFMLLFSYWIFVGSLYSHLSLLTSPSTPSWQSLYE